MAEVMSPVTRKGSKVGSQQPLSPGAKSSPSRSGGPQTDSIPPQSPNGGASRHSEEPSGSMEVIGPEE
jgi:hypothetical protein